MKYKPKHDYTGQIFSEIKIIGIDEVASYQTDTKNTIWLGQCLICGQVHSYKMLNLKHRKTLGCGACAQVNLIGQRFGRLVVKKFIGKKKCGQENGTRNYFLCECDCGNLIETNEHYLKQGQIKSCGCYIVDKAKETLAKFLEPQLKDLTGEKQGLLTIERLATKDECKNRPQGLRYWFARCECGNSHIVSTSDFTQGKVLSCGCLISKGEQTIISILMKNNIVFSTQYTFSDLKGKKNKSYAFDFGILDNNYNLKYLIEYDGIQHFDMKKQFTNGDFEKIQQRDQIKNQYCKDNNIPLIRIPYTQLPRLSMIDLDINTTSFRLI